MAFNLETAMIRITKELEEIIDQCWPEFEGSLGDFDGEHTQTLHDRVRYVQINARNLEQDTYIRFRLLLRILTSAYWQTDEEWSKFSAHLSAADKEFYAKTILGVAQDASKTADKRKGCCWIVECRRTGYLSDYIDDDLFKNAVNHGFFEMADEFFTRPDYGCVVMSESYHRAILTEHAHLLDIQLLNQIKDPAKPLYYGYPWVTKQYIQFIEEQENRISLADAAFFARPIIDMHVRFCTIDYEREPKDIDPKQELQSRLLPYQHYLGCKTIQELLAFRLGEHIEGVKNQYSETDWLHALAIPLIMSYIRPEMVDWQTIATEQLDLQNDHEVWQLASSGLKVSLFAPRMVKTWRAILEQYIPVEESKQVKKGQPVGILASILEATTDGWLDRNWTKNFIVAKLENYLKKKSAPTPTDAAELLNCLKNNIDLIGEKLFCRIIERCLVSFPRSTQDQFKLMKQVWEGRLMAIRQSARERQERELTLVNKKGQRLLDL